MPQGPGLSIAVLGAPVIEIDGSPIDVDTRKAIALLAYLAVGGYEAAFPGMYEDQVFFSKVAFSYPVLPGAGCLDRYRQHADSICSVTDRIGTRLVARRKYLDWMREFLHGARANDPRLWEALREEAWLARERGWVPDRWRARARWLDRWLLRAESTLLPDTLRRGLWSRRMPGWNGTEAP